MQGAQAMFACVTSSLCPDAPMQSPGSFITMNAVFVFVASIHALSGCIRHTLSLVA
jgi:hypothetical protein